MANSPLTPALAALAAGGMILLTDDAEREDEGDLCMAAAAVTPAHVAFMARHGRGLICAPMAAARADALGLPPMVAATGEGHGAAFAVSCDARTGIASGISAADRARTLSLMAAATSTAADLVRPGHLFALRARLGGVLERPGHTEGCVDLLALAGQGDVGVLCEVVNDDGTVARGEALRGLAVAHRLPMLQIDDVVAHRLASEIWVCADPDDEAGPLQVALPGARVVARWLGQRGPPGRPMPICLDGPGVGVAAAAGGLHVAVQLPASSAALPPGHGRLLALGLAAQAARARGCSQVRWPAPLDGRGRALLLGLGLTPLPA